MNKTEPVREAQELRKFGSSDLGKFGSAELTNFDSARSNELLEAEVRNFQTPAVPDSPCSALPTSDTFELREGVSS